MSESIVKTIGYYQELVNSGTINLNGKEFIVYKGGYTKNGPGYSDYSDTKTHYMKNFTRFPALIWYGAELCRIIHWKKPEKQSSSTIRKITLISASAGTNWMKAMVMTSGSGPITHNFLPDSMARHPGIFADCFFSGLHSKFSTKKISVLTV